MNLSETFHGSVLLLEFPLVPYGFCGDLTGKSKGITLI